MKKTLLTILPLLLIVGCSKVEGQQKLIPVVETYNDGDIKSITYHKITRNKIKKVKYDEYHSNGQKKKEETYKDGKKDGLWTGWYWHGQKSYEYNYKDGADEGLQSEWYENGQKKYELTYKNGERDGLSTGWYENGQKMAEVTFKDGKEISSKCWDKDGNEKECD